MHLVSQSVFLKTLGWSLFNSLWQMASLWLLYIIITSAGKKFPAKAKHLIAVLILGIGSAWFFISFLSSYFINLESSVTDNALATFSVNNNFYLQYNTSRQLINKSLPFCSIIYLAILIFQFARYSKYYWHSCRLRLTGLHKAPPLLRVFVENVAKQLGIQKKVSVWLSSVADSPMTVGFLKSVILIPIATINHLSTQQVEAILLHELAHIKRSDYFLNLLITFTGILFFFNPFSRLIIRSIRKEAENSCDDLVMQFRYDPHTYISALLSLEKTRTEQQLAMAAIGKNNQVLLERVKRITGQKHRFQYNSTKLLLFFLIAIIACLTAWFQPRPSVLELADIHRNIIAVPTETKEVNYHILEISSSKKNIKINPTAKCKKNITEPAIKKDRNHESNLTLVCDNDQHEDGLPEKNNISLAIQPDDERSYSISHDEENAVPAIKETAGHFPFVPTSSFTYKIIEDTIRQIKRRLNYDQRKTKEAIQKTLIPKDAINLEKIDNEIPETFDEADEQRIQGDIKLQLKALQNNKLKSQQEIQKLQQQILKAQIKLQQQYLQKQHEILKNIEDEIRKKVKIVYI